MRTLHVIVGSPPSEEESRFLALASFMGIPVSELSVEGAASLQQGSDDASSTTPALAVSAHRLATLRHVHGEKEWAALLRKRYDALLVFGWKASPDHAETLAELSAGAIRQTTCGSRSTGLRFSEDPLCFQFAGLPWPLEVSESVPVFSCESSGALRPLLLLEGEPVFLVHSSETCRVFLLSDLGVPDIHIPIPPSEERARRHLEVVPYLVFLRSALPESGWQGVRSTARLIIDDPLLTKTYGFLDFRKLLVSMDDHGFGASIAFIPWNHKRTSRRFASWLSANSHRFSVCVHGCDHTGGEFGVGNETHLRAKSRLALERMQAQEQRVGLPYEEVMVFPQGIFSTRSLRALQSTNYLAAVNSGLFPVDPEGGSPTISDFLRPAMTRFHGFPVFHRHYPVDKIDFAFDLFLGKPAFIVEHHGFFEHGEETLEDLVGWLNESEEDLSWDTLSNQLTESCLARWLDDDTIEVMFFTRCFRMENPYGRKLRLSLTKHLPEPTEVAELLLDGRPVDVVTAQDRLRLECDWEPGETKTVEIVYKSDATTFRPGLRYRSRVAARRYLSEFRDNTLSKHPWLSRMAARSLHAIRTVRR